MKASGADVPVLIVGGGPIGLTCAVLLAKYGIRSLLVERNASTMLHPRARSINARSMEIFRLAGVEGEIRKVELASEKFRYTVWCESLAGKELERRQPVRAKPEFLKLSPVRNSLTPQEVLEPILREHAQATGLAEIRFGTEMTGFERSAGGVVARLKSAGGTSEARARYMIAADGIGSATRKALGIELVGKKYIYQSVNILFHCDLTRFVSGRESSIYIVEQDDFKGIFLTVNGVDRWAFLYYPPMTQSLEGYTKERCEQIVRRAIGDPAAAVEVKEILPWKASAVVADAFRKGSVFLAGDSAHAMPHTGGLGMNTGVGDASSLCWKLAAVLNGQAGEALLDTYEAERLPADQFAVETAYQNAVSRGLLGTTREIGRKEFLNEMGVILGTSYERGALIPDGSAPPEVRNRVIDYVPVGRPGHRAPHVWLARNGSRATTLDLFGAGWVLLAGPQGSRWKEAAKGAASRLGLSLEAFTIGPGGDWADEDGEWARVYGVGPEGAVLVRPDGMVAWRRAAGEGDPESVLDQALCALLHRASWRAA